MGQTNVLRKTQGKSRPAWASGVPQPGERFLGAAFCTSDGNSECGHYWVLLGRDEHLSVREFHGATPSKLLWPWTQERATASSSQAPALLKMHPAEGGCCPAECAAWPAQLSVGFLQRCPHPVPVTWPEPPFGDNRVHL